MAGVDGHRWLAGHGAQLSPTGKDCSSDHVHPAQTSLPARWAQRVVRAALPLVMVGSACGQSCSATGHGGLSVWAPLRATGHIPISHTEEDGRDLCCVVSSLVQLMVDPFFRSISGFESLVQKEWVAMGHPFTSRHHLTSRPQATTAQAADRPAEEIPVEVQVH